MSRSRSVLTLAIALAAGLAGTAPSASAAAPVCVVPVAKVVRPDTVLSVLPNCGLPSLPFGAFAFKITDAPDHGTARVASYFPGALRYFPGEGYTGPDQFSYTVTTADGTSAPVTQQITVSTAANNVPYCGTGLAPKIRAGATRTLALSCMDEDGDAVTIEPVAQPAHGQVSLSSAATSVDLKADAGYAGADSFSFRGNDGRGTSTTVVVPYTVLAAGENAAPTCTTVGTQNVQRDAPIMIGLSCQDADGDPYAVEVVTPPSHGAAEGSAAAVDAWLPGAHTATYAPDAGYTGSDGFTVRARDSQGATSPVISIPVTVSAPLPQPAPASPACNTPSTLVVRAGTPRTTYVSCSASAPAGAELLTAPAHGIVKIVGSTLLYTPAAGYIGADSFSYRVLSAGGSGPEVTQAVMVGGATNTAPSCGIGAGYSALPPGPDAVVRAGTSAPVSASCWDPDGDTTTLAVDGAEHGTALGFVPVVSEFQEYTHVRGTYTPDAGFVGYDTLRVTGSDGRGGQDTRTFDFLVRPASYNTAPSCTTMPLASLVVVSGGEAEYAEMCGDGEGDRTSMEIVTPASHLTFSPFEEHDDAVSSVVRADPGYAGVQSFTLRTVDDRGARGGLYGRSIRVIHPEEGIVDRELGRGESAGAGIDDLPTAGAPGSVRLTTLNGGHARIESKSGSAPDGYAAFGLSFDITAPDAIPEAPLRLRFRFDGSLITGGTTVDDVTVFRNGVAVAPCSGNGATPNPCVLSRQVLAGGDVEIVVLTVKASTWSFGRALATQPPGGGTTDPPVVKPPVVTPPGGNTGGTSSGGGRSATTVASRPTITLGSLPRLKIALARGLAFKVTSASAGAARASLTLDGPTAKRLKLSRGKAVTVASGSTVLRAGAAKALTVKFTSAARRAIGTRFRKLRLKLSVAVGDGPPATTTITLKR